MSSSSTNRRAASTSARSIEIYGFINELAAQGKGIVLISSELPEVLGLSDRIYTLAEGRITAEVARADATQERLMRSMTAGR